MLLQLAPAAQSARLRSRALCSHETNRLGRRALYLILAAMLASGCSADPQGEIDDLAGQHRTQCTGAYTVDCTTLRVDHNVLVLTSAIESARAERQGRFKVLSDAEFEHGIKTFEQARSLEQDDRPGFLSRWFFGERSPFGRRNLPEQLVSTRDLQELFFTAVVDKREKEGKDVSELRAIIAQGDYPDLDARLGAQAQDEAAAAAEDAISAANAEAIAADSAAVAADAAAATGDAAGSGEDSLAVEAAVQLPSDTPPENGDCVSMRYAHTSAYSTPGVGRIGERPPGRYSVIDAADHETGRWYKVSGEGQPDVWIEASNLSFTNRGACT